MPRRSGDLLEPMKPTGRSAYVLFFAALPPPDIRAQIAVAWRRSDIDARLRSNVLHLSIQGLVGVNDVPDDLVDGLNRAGELTQGNSFDLCFDRVEVFGRGEGNRPVVLSTDRKGRGANDLAICIRRALSRVGFPPVDTRKVEPHVTMAYVPGERNSEKLFQPIHWRVTEFSLVQSVQGEGRHIVLGTWPLVDGVDPQGSLF
ncbi:MAG: hypothetical protein DI533_07730 [Cereibacter sphaeroides]|uniref:2'-5' RNA ligase n=1 Tax=Cereibacter sphaeroides TaxID=1063 RepID=A0A2W5SE39_CERSP|nr:MAG: hypothetical protein DI533_07730 [Cereibacter sphaeroides]